MDTLVSFYYDKKGLISMNYKKCMKNNTCKTCSDYMFCKEETPKRGKKKNKKANLYKNRK